LPSFFDLKSFVYINPAAANSGFFLLQKQYLDFFMWEILLYLSGWMNLFLSVAFS